MTATVDSRPTFKQMLESLEKVAKSHFEKNGIEAAPPFQVADESPESLKQAANALQQMNIMKQYATSEHAENAAYHAIIMTRHFAELEQALLHEDAEATQDSRS